ncbi:hydrolase [Xanthomonas citri pv. punicae str. LMG 859]|nr:hydrolase [Xanthomonas citri pv. punicae str. LMG 859]
MSAPRPTLLLLPGLLNDAQLWQAQRVALADVADCVVGDITQGDSMRALAMQLLAQMPLRFALAGFSLGGYVAQEILRIAPERVERLALLDTSARADPPERAWRQCLPRVRRAAAAPLRASLALAGRGLAGAGA